jgi:hypothetical protein
MFSHFIDSTKKTRLHLWKMLSQPINRIFFVSIQLKSAIMHRSMTYLILIIRLVVKSFVIQIKDQSRNLSMQLSLVNLVVKVIFHMAKIPWLYIRGQHSKTLCQNLDQLISKFTLHLNLCTWFKFHSCTSKHKKVHVGHIIKI